MSTRVLAWVGLLVVAVLARPVMAHEVRPAYLQITMTSDETFDILWKVPVRGGTRLGLYAELPAGATEVGERRGAYIGGAFVERWSARRAGGLSGREIRISGLEATGVDVIVRVEHLNGAVQSSRVFPDDPTLEIEAVPSRWGVASTYLVIGVEHILLGIDHLLFVLALVMLVKGWRRLVQTITAFTIAHSITLSLAALGMVSVPGPPVEACIALSIVFVAAEIVRGRTGRPGITERAPWIVAFTFGLLHGLGFAGALADVGLPQHAIPMALLFFNVGVEIGQLLFIAVVLAIIAVVRRLPGSLPAWSWRVVPYVIGPLAMLWVIERTAGFIG